MTDEDLAANPIEQYRPNHALNVNALKEWVAVTRIISPLSLFSRCPNTMMLPRSIKINAKKGGFPLEARAKTAVIREVLHWVPLGTKNRFAAVSELLKLAGFIADRKQIKNVDSFMRFGKT